MSKTTKDDLKYFKERVEYWSARFGLGAWEIDCKHDKLPDNTFADVTMCGIARHCIIRFSSDFGNYDNDKNTIDSVARHEVMEIVLYDLSTAAKSYFNEDYIGGLTHQVIHMIEHALDTK